MLGQSWLSNSSLIPGCPDMKLFKATCISLFLLLLTPIANTWAEDWPQFRGPTGQGHSNAKDVPFRWSENESIAWKVPIVGRGWSSPVVLGDQVWLTTAIETEGSPEELQRAVERVGAPVPNPYVAGEVTLKAICVDFASGRIVHDVMLFETDEPVVLNTVNSYASPTPVVESGRVYCDFGAMGTACVDAATGEILWSRCLPIEHQVGPGSSPILYGETLILTRDGCDQQYIAALDKATGRTVWKTPRPPHDTPVMVYRKAFTTPVVFKNDGTEQMVVVGAQWIVSYDPATGEERWRVDTGPTFSNASCPAYGDGMVYVCTAYGGTRMFAVRTDGRGDVTDTHIAWELQRSTPRRTSPLLVGGCLYVVSERGVASCVDARTGEAHWSERLDGAFSASPVFAGRRVYFFGENGTTTVVQPSDSFQSLAENHIDGRIMATPALVDQSIILRTDTHLFRIAEQTAQ